MNQEGGYIDDTLIKLLDGTNINNEYIAKDILNTIKFIESNDQIERDELLKTINNYMPIPIFIEFLTKSNINNFILINQQNYILIDKRNTNGKQYIFKLLNDYTIKEISYEDESVYYTNNINIFNLTPRLINSRISYVDKIFPKTLPFINENNYLNFNILIDNLYTNNGQLYNRNMNCILAFIFMNKLNDVLTIIDTLDQNLLSNTNNYYEDID